MGKEHGIQNQGRNALAQPGIFCTRANVGRGWTGKDTVRATRRMPVILEPGDVVIRQARPFDTGLPVGFSDTFGVVAETITQEMVGQVFGRAFLVEYKDGTDLSPMQQAFLEAMRKLGARAGVARSAAEAVDIVKGRHHVAR